MRLILSDSKNNSSLRDTRVENADVDGNVEDVNDDKLITVMFRSQG